MVESALILATGLAVVGLLASFVAQVTEEHSREVLARRSSGESDYQRYHPRA